MRGSPRAKGIPALGDTLTRILGSRKTYNGPEECHERLQDFWKRRPSSFPPGIKASALERTDLSHVFASENTGSYEKY